MLASTLIAYFFTVLTIAHAYVIPVKRIRIPKTSHDLMPTDKSALHRRHARFLRRDTQPAVQVVTQYVTQVVTLPAPTAPAASTSSQAASSAAASSAASASATPSTSSSPASAASSTASGAPSSTLASSSSTSTVAAPSASAPPAAGSKKYVVAHHMVGNTFPYTLQDWSDDIALAHASGIDGFALNAGMDDWQPARVADAYQAAKQSGLDFKLFVSLDMTSFPCASPNDAQTIRDFISPYLSHPNQLQYDNRAFVSTFSGETCTFGQGSVPDGWKNQFLNSGELSGKVFFVPSFFVDPAKFGDFAEVMDGDFNWNSGWPIQLTTSFAQSLLSQSSTTNNAKVDTSGLPRIMNAAVDTTSSGLDALKTNLGQLQNAFSKLIGSTDSDEQHLNGLKSLPGGLAARDGDGQSTSRAYMAAVSPWFFTHYGKDSFNKNFMYVSDQHLYAKRWESLISNRDQFDIVQVLTWNDYGESHYIGPIKGAQPNSQSWTDGMNHTGWLEMTEYYATAFKTGSFPDIETDKIYMWSRPHPGQATAQDPVGQPDNFELTEDTVWAVVMTTAPSTVVLTTSGSTSQSFDVPAGVTKLSIPISAGGTMQGTIQRDGKTVVELKPDGFTFQGSPKTYNFNAFVASASAK